jgi:heptosyltransferase II
MQLTPVEERIWIIRHRFIGDTLLMLPMLAALRTAKPHAHITVMSAPDSAPLLAQCPYVDQVWVFGTHTSLYGHAVKGFWQAVSKARQARFTAALVLKRSLSSAVLPWLAGVPVRVGHATEGRSLLLTKALPYHPALHESESFKALLDAFLGQATPLTALPQVWLTPTEQTEVSALWAQHIPDRAVRHMAFHIGASNSGKQWPLAHFVQLAKLWLGQHPGHHLHVLGGPADAPQAQALLTALPVALAPQVSVWAGKLALRQTADLLQRVGGLVSSDSGLSHLAAAVGTPVTVIFGPTNPQKWHPMGPGHTVVVTPDPPKCMPCNLKIKCEWEHVCLSAVLPQQVLEGLPKALQMS